LTFTLVIEFDLVVRSQNIKGTTKKEKEITVILQTQQL